MVMRLIDARTGVDAVKLSGPGKQIRDNTKTGPGKQIRNNTKTFSTNEICWSPEGKRVVGIDLDYEVKPVGISGSKI